MSSKKRRRTIFAPASRQSFDHCNCRFDYLAQCQIFVGFFEPLLRFSDFSSYFECVCVCVCVCVCSPTAFAFMCGLLVDILLVGTMLTFILACA